LNSLVKDFLPLYLLVVAQLNLFQGNPRSNIVLKKGYGMTKRYLGAISLFSLIAILGVASISFSAEAASSRKNKSAQSPAPITLRWSPASESCNFGSELQPYIDHASADFDRQARAYNNDDIDMYGVARVNRPWRNLTVTAVSVSYGSALGIYFKEPLSTVAAQLRSVGLRPANRDARGEMMLINQESFNSGLSASRNRLENTYGTTVWFCVE
jgi:hypothetical protein